MGQIFNWKSTQLTVKIFVKKFHIPFLIYERQPNQAQPQFFGYPNFFHHYHYHYLCIYHKGFRTYELLASPRNESYKKPWTEEVYNTHFVVWSWRVLANCQFCRTPCSQWGKLFFYTLQQQKILPWGRDML